MLGPKLLAILALAGVPLAAPPALAAQDPASDGLTAWAVATMRSVSSAVVSPDGRHVAWVLSVQREPGREEDGPARSELHVLEVASGRTRAFVTADSGVRAVEWMPDGGSILFLAKRGDDEHAALWSIAIDGGEALRALHLEDRAVGRYAVSPDGATIAFLATPPEPEEAEKWEKKGFAQEVYEEEGRPAELWLAAPYATEGDDAAEPTRVPLEGHPSDLVWSPDGSRLALAVAPTTLVDDGYVRKRVRVVTREGEVVARVENGGKLGSFVWKPDGTGLALVAGIDEHDGAAARLLWAALPAPGGTVEPTPILGERERDEEAVAWTDGGLVVLGSQGVWSTVDRYRFEDGRAVDRRPLLPLEGPVWTGMSVSRDGRLIALVGSTPGHGSELYTLDAASGTLQRRTHVNPWLDELALAPQEVVSWEARDGLRIEGVLMRPADGSAPAPLLVVVHGGPESHLSNGWLTSYASPGQLAALGGYAVLYPNYRGSTGRGLAYLKASQGDPAGAEFDDVVDGVDHLIATGVADPARVGVTGGSYGGYATAWLSTRYTERFAAGVMFVGISDKVSKVGTTDIPDEEFLVHALKRPWEDWQFFLERSPIYHADGARTPLLILHGKDDPRVNPGQSREMYRHLDLRGEAPVRLVEYPGEGHGNRKAGARFDYNLRMLRWFDHYLKGEGGDPPPKEIDYEAFQPKEPETAEGP